MKPIELPILFKSQEKAEADKILEQLELPISQGTEDDSEIRAVTFYRIEAVTACKFNGKWISQVDMNGDYYVCPLTYKELTQYINSQLPSPITSASNEINAKVKKLLAASTYPETTAK